MTSVALVVLDTLRKDAFDRHFDWLPGLRFEHAYSTANWTVPAHASLFTGRYPGDVGVHAKSLQFEPAAPALAERLRESGYATRAYSANPNVSGHFGFDRGFETFRSPSVQEQLTREDVYDWRRLARTEGGAAAYARALFECVRGDWKTIPSAAAALSLLTNGGFFGVDSAGEALRFVRELDVGEREFCFVNLMEVHEPHDVPESFRTVPAPEMVPTIGECVVGDLDHDRTRRAYDDAARYLSSAYRELFAELSAAFDVVITLSDHGEQLGERGCWGHEYGVGPALTHVPLVVSGVDRSGSVDAPVSLRDVYPTVLDLAGIDHDAGAPSLLSPRRDRECRTEYHGLTPWSADRLDDAGYDVGTIETYERPAFGYAAHGYYGYEHLGEVYEAGTAPPGFDLEGRLRDLPSGRDEADAGRAEVPEAVRAQLEGLGYR